MVFNFGVNLHSLITNEVENIFTRLSTIHVSSFVKCLFKLLLNFSQ